MTPFYAIAPEVRIQSLKKTVTKGDKKKRREVNEEVARIEKEMEEKHAREQHELDMMASCSPVAEADQLVVPTLAELSMQESPQQPKLSKAQKRRVSDNQQAQEHVMIACSCSSCLGGFNAFFLRFL